MELVDDLRCFVCGKNNDSGLKLEIKSDKNLKKAWAVTKIDDKFCGWSGVVHGGIISTVLDEIMAYAAFTVYESGVTGEISVRFRKPVPTGREILIEGFVESQKGRVVYATGKITLDGETMAESTGKMVMVKSGS
ncbi:MAG TPA: PaaI family thioesterase [bacterium]|nr:PaaI family thioesterase [bacterium]HPS30355.1 PaaI family thioesterase [bacterium]